MYKPLNKQGGVTLIEALIAMVILAVGVLGLAGVQARQLVETRTANSRSIAVRLIDDLNERMQLNTAGVRAGNYALTLGSVPATSNCSTAACTPAQLASFDIAQWRANVASLLPNGNAAVFRNVTDTRQIGVLVAWNANEGKANSTSALADTAYTDLFVVGDAATAAAGANCPANFICHLVYLQP